MQRKAGLINVVLKQTHQMNKEQSDSKRERGKDKLK